MSEQERAAIVAAPPSQVRVELNSIEEGNTKSHSIVGELLDRLNTVLVQDDTQDDTPDEVVVVCPLAEELRQKANDIARLNIRLTGILRTLEL